MGQVRPAGVQDDLSHDEVRQGSGQLGQCCGTAYKSTNACPGWEGGGGGELLWPMLS